MFYRLIKLEKDLVIRVDKWTPDSGIELIDGITADGRKVQRFGDGGVIMTKVPETEHTKQIQEGTIDYDQRGITITMGGIDATSNSFENALHIWTMKKSGWGVRIEPRTISKITDEKV